MRLIYVEFVNPPCIESNKHVTELCPFDGAGLKRDFVDILLRIGFVAEVSEGAHALHHMRGDPQGLAELAKLGYHVQEPIYELVPFSGDRPKDTSDFEKGRVAN